MLATGGGAVLDPENRRLLAESGWVVYLEATVAQQAERAGRTRHRPLLNGGDPRRRLEELMQIREPLYRECATIMLDADSASVEQLVDDVLRDLPLNLRGGSA